MLGSDDQERDHPLEQVARAYDRYGALKTSIFVLALGIVLLVMGNTAARWIGAVMIALFVAVIAFSMRRFAKRSAKPSQ